jgi:hypothetical protein
VVAIAALALALPVLLTPPPLRAAPAEVSPLDHELDGPGTNVDDPCFWVDPDDPAASLVFVTAKDSGLVEVFNVVSGALVATIPGFGLPNNCAVEGDLLLTTDRTVGEVKVHHLPDLTFAGSFGRDMRRPEGIDVLTTPTGERLVYVTDSADASVHVYALDSGALVRTFPTGFGSGIEPIFADDRHQRIYVARGEKESRRGIGWFTPEGVKVQEFGASVFSRDGEGIALYACGDGGYLVIADQTSSATQLEIFDRLTLTHLGAFRLQDGSGEFTDSTDGVDILQTPLPGFPDGLVAACDGCGSSVPDEMDVVGWDRIAAVVGLERCPGGVPPDCGAMPCMQRLIASADAYVTSVAPDASFGSASTLEIEADPIKGTAETLLRFEVPDLGGLEIERVTLRLTVAAESGSESDAGGVLFEAGGPWSEDTVSYATRPAPSGAAIASAGPVALSQAVDFDVTPVVTGIGTYDFLLLSASANLARFRSREAADGHPTLLLTLHAEIPPTTTTTTSTESPTTTSTTTTEPPTTTTDPPTTTTTTEAPTTTTSTATTDPPTTTTSEPPTTTTTTETPTTTTSTTTTTTSTTTSTAASPTSTSTTQPPTPSSTTSTTSTPTTTTTTSSTSTTTSSTSTTTSTAAPPTSTSTTQPPTPSSTTSTTSTPTTTTTTTAPTTTSTTTSSTSTAPPTTTAPRPDRCGAGLSCDDGDHCTADSCDPTLGCVHADLAPGELGWVVCSADNVRELLRGRPGVCPGACSRGLARRVDRTEAMIVKALRDRSALRCQRALRAARLSARAIERRVARLASRDRGQGAPSMERLLAEARRLRERVAALASGSCRSRGSTS